MGNLLLNENFIRQRSHELQIPYEHLLAASVLEEVVYRLAESKDSECFWIKNHAKLNLECYRKKVDLQLYYFLKESKQFHYKKGDISNLFAVTFRNYKKDAVHWNYRVQMDGAKISVDLTGEIANVKVPVSVRLEPVTQENLVPYRKEIKLFTNNNRKVCLHCFPSENVIAEKFLEIMDKLELLNDLSCYMEVYDILKKESLSGRKVWELFMDGCGKRRIPADRRRFALWQSYRENRYMEQKWKAYLKREHRKQPDWQDVMDLADRFFSVIWDHMCRNVVYLGDWMPELGRWIE